VTEARDARPGARGNLPGERIRQDTLSGSHPGHLIARPRKLCDRQAADLRYCPRASSAEQSIE